MKAVCVAFETKIAKFSSVTSGCDTQDCKVPEVGRELARTSELGTCGSLVHRFKGS